MTIVKNGLKLIAGGVGGQYGQNSLLEPRMTDGYDGCLHFKINECAKS